MKHRPTTYRLLAGAGFAVLLAGLSASNSFAFQKITICHSTGSSANPFVAITVDLSSGDLFPHLDSEGNPLGGRHANDFLLNFEGDADDCVKAAGE